MEIQECVQLFMMYLRYSLPFAIIFAFGIKLTNMILETATSGRIKF